MFLGFRGLQSVASWLPWTAAQALGRGLGLVAYGCLRGHRRLSLRHLEQALGDRVSVSERRRIARGAFQHLGQSAMEWLQLPKLSNEEVQRLVRCEGVEHLRQVVAQGRGGIILTAHFGNWELLARCLTSLGFQGGVLARRLRYPEYEQFLIELRKQQGIQTVARGSAKDIAKLLRSNQLVGILPDQDIDSVEGMFVDFFGRAAYTPLGPAALSLMTGAPIIPCFMIRQPTGFRFVVEPPLPLPRQEPDTHDRGEAIAQLTRAWSRVVESHIRREPSQWVWMHRRWKTQPPPAASEQPPASNPRVTSQQHVPRRPPHTHPVLVAVLVAWCVSLVATMAGCAKSEQPTRSEVPATDTEQMDETTDQAMSAFTLTGIVSGEKEWELTGYGATVDGSIVTIRRPEAVGYDPERTTYLTASAAQVQQPSRNVRMEHDVTIHTSDGLWLTTPILHWLPNEGQFETEHAVRIETDHMLLRGRGATGRTPLKEATLLTDIEMVLNPSETEVPGGPSHVHITCDGPLAFDYEKNIATFQENVHVKDANGDLYSDTLIAYLDSASHTIRYAEAIGQVRIEQAQHVAHSERAIYEPALGKVTLVGRPSLLVQQGASSRGPAQVSLEGLRTSPVEREPANPYDVAHEATP